MTDRSSDDYILGTRDAEILRLGTQHQTWLPQAYSLFERAGLRGGDRVADLGSGPGYMSFELAELVGARGRVIACDLSPRFLNWLRQEAANREFHWLTTVEISIEELDLPAASLDAAYARWLLCWLPDPAPVITSMATALSPGGALLIQDYLDWGIMTMMPRSKTFDRAVEACRASFAAAGADPRVCARMPALARDAGLDLEYLQPVARTGEVGSLVWRWVTDFLRGYLPGLVEQGFIGPEELSAFLRDIEACEESGRGRLLCPLMADVVMRKPER